jgi:hypothetical protein
MKKFLNLLMIPLLVLLFFGDAWSVEYSNQIRGGSSIDQSSIAFSGSGQNDINVSGSYSGDQDRCYEVAVTATSTMKWRANCSSGAYTTGVSMTTSAVEIENGISLSWDTAAGHTATDTWKFRVKAFNPLIVSDAQGGNMMAIQNDDDIAFLNGTVTSQNAFIGMGVTDAVGQTYLKFNREFVDIAGTVALTASDCGKVLMSDDVGNAKSYTLPNMVQGCTFGFYVGGAGLLTATPFSGDTIRCNTNSTTVSISSSTKGEGIEIFGSAIANEWQCRYEVGTMTYN